MKIYVEEEGSALVRERLGQVSVVATSLIAYVEIRAALARRRHEGDLSSGEYRRIRREFEADWQRYLRLEVSESLVRDAADLAETHRLRGYDAIHLASAMTLRARSEEDTMFGSWDRALDASAAREGFRLLRARRS